MIARQLVNKLLSIGVRLSTDGCNIDLVCERKLKADLIDVIRKNKSAMITELLHRQQLWLFQIANGLGMQQSELFEEKILAESDVQMYWHIEPNKAVTVLRSSYMYIEAKG